MGNTPPSTTTPTAATARDHPKKNDDASDDSQLPNESTSLLDNPSDARTNSRKNPPRCLPLSQRLIGSLAGGMYCRECRTSSADGTTIHLDPAHSLLHDDNILNTPKDEKQEHHDYNLEQVAREHSAVISPLVLAPMLQPLEPTTVGKTKMATLEAIMAEYIATCKFYGCASRVNAGVLTTLRFALPSLRVSGDFHDADMLALAEILLRYGNGPLRFIKRLDFSRSSREGKEYGQGIAGFRSHGALTLSKVLQSTEFVEEVRLQGNRLGPYGASAIFLACSRNRTIKRLALRRCLIGARGGLAFAELLRRDMEDQECGLVDVDLSVNRIGFRASVAIEEAMMKRVQHGQDSMYVDLMGNLVLQEVRTDGLNGWCATLPTYPCVYHRGRANPLLIISTLLARLGSQ